MKKRNLLLSLLSLALVAVIGVGATLAYFTDTDNRTNTFTAAGADGAALDITLTETSENRVVGDVTLNAGTAQENGFKYDNVLPGLAYDKNAVVTLENGSVDSHLYIELVISNYSALMNAIEGVSGIDANALQDSFLVNPNENITRANIVATKMDGDNFKMVFDFGEVTDPEGDPEYSVQLFDGVKVPANMTKENMEKLEGKAVDLTINAYAIQEETGDTAVLDAAIAEWFSDYTVA